MPTAICCAASTAEVEPLKDTPGSGGGASPAPDRLKVRVSIFKDPDVWPSVIGTKPTSNETVAPLSTFTGSAGRFGSVKTPVAGPVALMLLMKATVLPVLLICTWAEDVDPTCVGVKITVPLVPKGVLAELTTAVYVRLTPTPTPLRLKDASPILRRAVNVPD